MKQFIHSLTFKIGLVIIVTEIVVLSISGYILYGRFSEEIDQRIAAQLLAPARLINSGRLGLDAVADKEIMQQLVGEELLDGMVIGTNRVVFYSLNPDYVGQPIDVVPDMPTALFDPTNPQLTVMHMPDSFVNVAPIYSTDGRTPRFFVYLKVGTNSAQDARNQLIMIFGLSTAVTVLATTLMIILSFRWMIFHRLADVLRVLQLVEAGDLTARTRDNPSRDEIGQLQQRVDEMAAHLERMVGTLQESEDRYRRLVENAPYGVAIVQEEQIVYVNQAGMGFIGASDPGQLIGQNIWQFVKMQYLERSREWWQRVLRGKDALPLRELEFVRLEGTTFHVEAIAIPFMLEGDPAGQVVFRDISDRKLDQEKLEAYAAELERSNQELQNFAYISSHDLQEPLRKIQTFGDRLATRYGSELDDHGLDYLRRMQAAANRMQILILDLLSFSRVTTQARPFEPVDLSVAVKESLADLDLLLVESQGQVKIGDLPTIEADPAQMRQLFQNLLNNALKFRREGVPSIIQVSAEPLPEPDKLCRILVSDNGIGFEEKYQERIFEMFQRLHGRHTYPGTGIGLAVCRKIVERHNGTIKATSVPGQGSTFILTLPLKQDTD